MRRVPALLLVALVAGCNSLTGTDDLELVNGCVDCEPTSDASVDTSKPDAASPDTGAPDTGAPDTAEADSTTSPTDTGPEASSDAADAADAADAKPFCTSNKMCNDLDPCTTDVCQVLTGVCTNTLNDGDGDGEAASTLGACGLDCYDANKDVFSKQTAYFTKAYTTAAGTTSFDYNCDGASTRQFTTTGSCVRTGITTCTLTAGWTSTIPPCGASGSWMSSCIYNGAGGCTTGTTTKLQACR